MNDLSAAEKSFTLSSRQEPISLPDETMSSDGGDALVRAWASAFSSEVLSFARPEEVSNEEVFAEVYHSLIHSAGLSATLLQLEHGNAAVIGEKCGERRREVAAMFARQAGEMEAAVEAAAKAANSEEDGASEAKVNRLAAQHMEEAQMTQLRWDTALGDARDTQRREFREWVMCVHEELKTNGGNGEKAHWRCAHRAAPAATSKTAGSRPLALHASKLPNGLGRLCGAYRSSVW